MRKLIYATIALAAISSYAKYDVAAFVWPAYQPEARWQELNIFNHRVGEWQSVYETVPKFEGHSQPKIPLWGYENEADPIAVARKIDAALAAGINIFIYDWYWYQGRPFLENGLNEGFLKAPNNERMKFFIMWANHDVKDYWDNTKEDKWSREAIWEGAIPFDEFKKIAHRALEQYFKKPNYYMIDGKPVYGIYELHTFVKGVGGIKKAKEALDYFRRICKDAGFKGAYFMVIDRFPDKVEGEIPNVKEMNSKEIAKYLQLDSFSTYNWVHIMGDSGVYKNWAKQSMDAWEGMIEKVGIPYFANVSLGWDNNARFPKRTLSPMIKGSNPKDYKDALIRAKDWMDKNSGERPKLILINSWNEWTEGSYLEPDAEFGYGYLNATADIFFGK